MEFTNRQDLIDKLKPFIREEYSYTDVARKFLIKYPSCSLSVRTLRKYASQIQGTLKDELNYPDDELVPFQGTLEEHAKALGIPVNEIKTSKSYVHANGRIGHTIVREAKDQKEIWFKDVQKHFESKPKVILPALHKNGKEAIVCTADWHIGAYIKNLIATHDYNLDILKKYLAGIAVIINKCNLSKVHLTINGDLIESFSGLNHQGSWKEMELWGKNATITAYEVVVWWVEQIENIESITIISGNHDRSQSNKDLEYEGEIAGIIAYFFKQKLNCAVNYHAYVYNLIVDGISYILCHGDKKFINNPSDVAWKYGKQGMYNCIIAAHKHTRQKTDVITTNLMQSIIGDANGLRLIYCPSLFTGNFYSEALGYTSDAGFYIITNFFGKPFVQDIPLSMEFTNYLSL